MRSFEGAVLDYPLLLTTGFAALSVNPVLVTHGQHAHLHQAHRDILIPSSFTKVVPSTKASGQRAALLVRDCQVGATAAPVISERSRS